MTLEDVDWGVERNELLQSLSDHSSFVALTSHDCFSPLIDSLFAPE